MWTREGLKTRAKEKLKRYYWTAFLVSFLVSVVGNLGARVVMRFPDGGAHLGRITEHGISWSFVLGTSFVVILIQVAWDIFVTPALTVGKNRFYMESCFQGEAADVGRIFWGFTHRYLCIVKTMFVKDCLIFLLSVLGQTPLVLILTRFLSGMPAGGMMGGEWRMSAGTAALWGIGSLAAVAWSLIWWAAFVYFQYSWFMVPYILSEYPDMKTGEVLKLSREMMRGHKWKTFVLEISFLGWILLGVFLCCGVGLIFFYPYLEATMAELYAVLRAPYFGRPQGSAEQVNQTV